MFQALFDENGNGIFMKRRTKLRNNRTFLLLSLFDWQF